MEHQDDRKVDPCVAEVYSLANPALCGIDLRRAQNVKEKEERHDNAATTQLCNLGEERRAAPSAEVPSWVLDILTPLTIHASSFPG
jgi:hypothetical protein